MCQFVSRSVKPIEAFALYPTHVVTLIGHQCTGVGNPEARIVPSTKNIEVSDETVENQVGAFRAYGLDFVVQQIDVVFAVQLSGVGSGRRHYDTFPYQGNFATLERVWEDSDPVDGRARKFAREPSRRLARIANGISDLDLIRWIAQESHARQIEICALGHGVCDLSLADGSLSGISALAGRFSGLLGSYVGASHHSDRLSQYDGLNNKRDQLKKAYSNSSQGEAQSPPVGVVGFLYLSGFLGGFLLALAGVQQLNSKRCFLGAALVISGISEAILGSFSLLGVFDSWLV